MKESQSKIQDSTRPFLEVIHERAHNFEPYPQRLVELFKMIPRDLFVPEPLRASFLDRVHTDAGGWGLLSQPGLIFDMVALLHLKGKEIVFEGGTGTGYQTAILARMSSHIYTVERDVRLLEEAKSRLATLGIDNVTFIGGDAANGFPEAAPFDRMIFGCAFYGIADQHLTDQLASSRSRLIAPTGNYDREKNMILGDLLMCKKKEGVVTQTLLPVYQGTLSFAPLISSRAIGWSYRSGGYAPTSQVSKKIKLFPWQR